MTNSKKEFLTKHLTFFSRSILKESWRFDILLFYKKNSFLVNKIEKSIIIYKKVKKKIHSKNEIEIKINNKNKFQEGNYELKTANFF